MRTGNGTVMAVACVAVLAVGSTGCAPEAGEDAPTATVASSAGTSNVRLAWALQSDGVETATMAVPLDHDDPDGPSIELFVARHLATDLEQRIGSLLVNPGGPGVGGADLAIHAESTFDPALLARFDIVGWDPRGTGRSTPAIDCVDDLDQYLATVDLSSIDGQTRADARTASEELAAGCAARSGDLRHHVGTNDAARDMDLIRTVLAEDRVSYLGFSYGSDLGATWATMFPTTVRAAVLDGAADPGETPTATVLQRAAGFEGALTTYLSRCSSDPSCPFSASANAAGAFDDLMAQLSDHPIPSEPGRPAITRAVAQAAVSEAMYSDAYWNQLSVALVAAARGDGRGLLALWDAHVGRLADGTWSNVTEARLVIRCMDQAERPTVADVDATLSQLAAVAPRLGGAVASELDCTPFPAPTEPRVPITGAGAGPIVVIGTTGDPATPLPGTRAMATAIEDGHLVVVDAAQHTGYGTNACVNDVVRRYLVDLDVPDAATSC